MAETNVTEETTPQKNAESHVQNLGDSYVSAEKLLDCSCHSTCAKDLIKEISPQVSEAEVLYSKKEYKNSLDLYIEVCHQVMTFLRSGNVQASEKRTLQDVADKLLSRAEKIKLLCPGVKICPGVKNEDEVNLYGMLKLEMLRDHEFRDFDNIAGCEELKTFLKKHVCVPCKFSKIALKYLTSTILLYGHPGTGKSLFLEATAHGSGIKLFVFNLYCLGSKHYGGQDNLKMCIKTIFDVAQNNRPCILCLEDIHVLNSDQERYRRGKTEIMIRLQDIMAKGHLDPDPLIVFGVTQKPWLLDRPMLKRCFQSRQLVDLPSLESRAEIIRQSVASLSHNMTAEDMMEVARRTEGFTGADLVTVVRDASMEPLRKLQKAQYFKKIWVHGEENSNTDTQGEKSDSKEQESLCAKEDAPKHSDKDSEDDNKEEEEGCSKKNTLNFVVSERAEKDQDTTQAENTPEFDAAEDEIDESGFVIVHGPCDSEAGVDSAETDGSMTVDSLAAAASEAHLDNITVTETDHFLNVGDTDGASDKAIVENENDKVNEGKNENIIGKADDNNTAHAKTEKAEAENVQCEIDNGSGLSQEEIISNKPDAGLVEKFIACEASEEGAMKATFMDIPEDKIYVYPEISLEYLLLALRGCKASVLQEEEDLMRDFAEL